MEGWKDVYFLLNLCISMDMYASAFVAGRMHYISNDILVASILILCMTNNITFEVK